MHHRLWPVFDAAFCVRAGASAVMVVLPLQLQAVEVTHCVPPEQSVFSCTTGTKIVAVCRTPELTADSGALQYRFGLPAALELSFPPAGADWRVVTRGGTVAFSGGGGAWLAFTNARYRYVVYSAVGQGWGSKAGVVVEKDGKRIATLACKGVATSELGPDLFSKAGVEAVEGDFDLPR